ncbi:hypothetical protein [Escherichia albertii]|uniref:hypothetical protein n=1 Tax=Escherichia albertii TaxID=208962 RepID=UPI0011F32A73|nr:hypothetical protein [Escherichia albertii]HEB0991094.1 hypothetical protein [Escherichia albertii]HEB0995639.1 hypothetical protein [Escherichia albertii]HEB1000199.1 hypothetical protein [Escherichia albertii]HEB1004781.1 hypothetical protein [Escherichia albertii]HEB1009304.1 hypothetical protein [Escherichia albertii]
MSKHTVTRILPEAFKRLASIKHKYPNVKHSALVGEVLKESVTLSPFDNIRGVVEGSKAVRITSDQLELLKAQSAVTGCSMIQVLSTKIHQLADKLGV